MDTKDLLARLGNWHGHGGFQAQALAQGLIACVRAGDLLEGDLLPPERGFAVALGVSRTTVKAAYKKLCDLGWAVSRQGSGTRIQKGQDAKLLGIRRRTPVSNPLAHQEYLSQDFPTLIDLSLAVARPDPSWTRLSETGQALLQSAPEYQPAGLPALRQRVAARMTQQGLPTDECQILVTNGVQHAISIVARHFCAEGTRVLVEDPTYFGALDAFRDTGAHLLGVRWDGAARERAFIDAIRRERPALAYVCPEFQNPTGHVWHETLWNECVLASAECDAVLVVDAALSDLAFSPQYSAIQALRHTQSAILLGGLSTTLWGGLRLGWLRAPQNTVATLASERLIHEFGANTISGALACDLLDRYPELIGQRVRALKHQKEVLTAELRRRLPKWRFSEPEGGQFLWIELPALHRPLLVEAFTKLALQYGVAVTPGRLLFVDKRDSRHIRLSFNESPDLLVEACCRLEKAWSAMETL